MTTMTEQEAIRVLRAALEGMRANFGNAAWLHNAPQSQKAAYNACQVALATTATIQPVAAPEPVAQGWDEKLFNFIDSVVEVAFEGGDLDGGTIQEWAETAGLLEARTMTEPCSEGQNCRCADGNDFPLTCYQKTYRRAAAPAQAATDGVRSDGQQVWIAFNSADDFEPVMFFTELPGEELKSRFVLKEYVCYPALRTTSTDKGEAA